MHGLLFYALIIGAMVLLRHLTSPRPEDVRRVAELLARTEPQGWHFVALRYQLGMRNRTYTVFVTKNALVAARVRGAIASPVYVSNRPDDPWRNPAFYPTRSLLARYVDMDLESDAVLAMDEANFRLLKSQIAGVAFDGRPKWGMGGVPYSGRLFVTRDDGKRLEFVLLGTQDGPALADRLRREILSSQAHAAYR
jgi:hypothetical protein